MNLFSDGLIFPAALLALLGWMVPRLLSRIFLEGVKPLMILAAISTLIMLFLGMGFFLALYIWQGAPISTLFEAGILAGLVHFGRLGLISALIWGPIMILSVAGLPRHWIKETW